MAKQGDLFNRKTIQRLCNDVKITSKQKQSAKEWLELLDSNKLGDEKSNYPKFMQIILQDILGYPIKELGFETDNVEFQFGNSEGKKMLCFEAKGTSTKDIFASQHRAKKEHETPIKQTWDYMGSIGLDYGICTNYKDFVLITKQFGYSKYHFFEFDSIARNEEKLKEFVGIFSKERIIEKGFVEKLHNQSVVEEHEFTKEFYKLYHETRLMMIKAFQEKEQVSHSEAIYYTQMFLNRLIFIFFVEDRGFIPDKHLFSNRILHILESGQFTEYSKKIYEDIKELFIAFDKGSKVLGVFGFNGSLFSGIIPEKVYFYDLKDEKFFAEVKQNSKLLKSTKLNEQASEIIKKHPELNPIISNMLIMNSFDFNTEVNVNILGHIFEQSISDLEDLKQENFSRRKREGVYYTPEYVTDYICRNTVIPCLSKSCVTSVDELIEEYKDNLEELENKFKEIKILDPACGSGAFLVKAVDILLEINKEIQNRKEDDQKSRGQLQITQEWDENKEIRAIVENNIYGVDINPESTDITKLSLFLKLASNERKLIGLSQNIKVGNSLVNDKTIDSRAFSWEDEFPEILRKIIEEKGFDVVIGNPPYVVSNPEKLSGYELVKGNYNTYVAFIEKALGLIKDNGKMSFIVPTTWLSGNNYQELRKTVLDYSINNIVQLPYDIFEAYIDTMIFSLDKKPSSNNLVKTYKYEIRDRAYQKPIEKYIEFEQIGWKKNENYTIILDSDLASIYRKYKKISSKKLSEISKINRGTLPPKQDELFKNPTNENFIEWFDGQVYRYIVQEGSGLFVDRTKLRERKPIELFLSPKIMARQLVSRRFRLQFAWFDKKMAFKKNLYAICEITEDPYFLLAILNSKLFSFIHVKANISVQRDDFPSFSLQDFRNFRIPVINVDIKRKLSELANKSSIISTEYDQKNIKVQRRVMDNFTISKIGSKLETIVNLEFKEFIEQIYKKSKQKITLSQQDEWEKYFLENKKELLSIEHERKIIEHEIDKLVYDIYDLNTEERTLVEDTLK